MSEKLRTCEGSQCHRCPIIISKAYPKNWAQKNKSSGWTRFVLFFPPNFFTRYPSTKSVAVQVYGRQRRYQKFLISYVFLSLTPTELYAGEVWCRITGLPTLTGSISVSFYTIEVTSSSNSRPDKGLADAQMFAQKRIFCEEVMGHANYADIWWQANLDQRRYRLPVISSRISA